MVERHQDGSRVTYRLSESGRELVPIVEAIGSWGIRWIPELGDQDLDPHLLLWDIHRRVDLQAVPDGRTTVEFSFSDVPPPSSDWWLVISEAGADVCDVNPGYDVRVTVRTSLRTLSRVWRGDVGLGPGAALGRAGPAGRLHREEGVPPVADALVAGGDSAAGDPDAHDRLTRVFAPTDSGISPLPWE